MPPSVRAQLPLSFFNISSLSEHNRERVEPMSTVTSADGTTIDYDAYGSGPTVIFIGGASQHRAIDQRTTEIAKQLAAEGFTAVDYDRRGRDRSGDTPPWSLGREVEDVAALIEATGAPAALYTSSSGAGIALAAVTGGWTCQRLLYTSRPTSPDPTAPSTSPRSSECSTPASSTKRPATT